MGYAFAMNAADNDDVVAPDFRANLTLKQSPSVQVFSTKAFSQTVQENIIWVLSGNFQYKFRPFLPLFIINAGDSWLLPGSQVELCVDLP